MQRNRIHQANLITVGGQPAGMHSCAATNIEDSGGPRRQQPSEKILGAQKLQPTGTVVQPIHLAASAVIGADRRGDLHGLMVSSRRPRQPPNIPARPYKWTWW